MHCFLFFWKVIMIELTPISIWTIQLLIKIFTFFSSVVLGNVRFFQYLLFSMGESTLISKSTFSLHFPVSAHFSFKLLLKIILRCDLQPWLYSFYFQILIIIEIYLIIFIFLFFNNILNLDIESIINSISSIKWFIRQAFCAAYILWLYFFVKKTEILSFIDIALRMLILVWGYFVFFVKFKIFVVKLIIDLWLNINNVIQVLIIQSLTRCINWSRRALLGELFSMLLQVILHDYLLIHIIFLILILRIL